MIIDHAHRIALEHGWWDNPRSDTEVIALIHSELSEALAVLRDGNPDSDKAAGYSCLEEEIADVGIAYDELDIHAQTALYAWVCSLIKEGRL